MRANLEALPYRMLHLPVDKRGYPVPWFVAWVNGEPEFRAMDPDKWIQAVRFKKCWVCGERLGRWMTFVAGPMCGINRTSSEPPSHKECAEWSARNCPFLSNPDAIRRQDDLIANGTTINGFAILRNPKVSMLWTCEDYTVFRDDRGGKLICMGEPTGGVDWYASGRKATREEVMASIDSGLPTLEAMASQEKGGLDHLQKAKERFMKYVPPEHGGECDRDGHES